MVLTSCFRLVVYTAGLSDLPCKMQPPKKPARVLILYIYIFTVLFIFLFTIHIYDKDTWPCINGFKSFIPIIQYWSHHIVYLHFLTINKPYCLAHEQRGHSKVSIVVSFSTPLMHGIHCSEQLHQFQFYSEKRVKMSNWWNWTSMPHNVCWKFFFSYWDISRIKMYGFYVHRICF